MKTRILGNSNLSVSAIGLGCMASHKGCTTAQLVLAWVLAQGDDVIPIPGTRREKSLRDNIAATEIQLSAEDLGALGTIMPSHAVAGARYGLVAMKTIDQ